MDAAHESLYADRVVSEGLGNHLVTTYIDQMQEYRKMLERIGNENTEEQKIWLMERF